MTGMTVGLLLMTAAPLTAEQLDLGRSLAETGALAALLPLIEARESAELISEDEGATPAQQAQLRTVSARIFRAGYDRLMAETGKAYAERLSVAELRTLLAFQRTPAAQHYRAVTPEVIAVTMQALGAIDFKGEVRKAYCVESGRLCDPQS